MIKKILNKTWDWIKPYLTWRMVPFLIIAWMITNGWAYMFVYIGPRYHLPWMTWLGGTWIAFLFFPLTAEKIITVFIAGYLYKLIYKEDFKRKEC